MNQTDFLPSMTCDVLVVGSGAAGLATAITAKKHGLDVIVVEKAAVFGGTSAFSGGVLWVPGSRYDKSGMEKESVVSYMKNQTGEFFDEAAVRAYVDHAPAMVEWFEKETAVKFVPTLYPDYHPDAPGGAQVGRSILAAPFDASLLGNELSRLRPPLETITFIGMMFNSSNADIKHFFRATKSLISAAYVARRLGRHFIDLLRYRRGVQVTSGNALVARLVKSCLDLGIPIHTRANVMELRHDGQRVLGAKVHMESGVTSIHARRGLVLACGGYSHDRARTGQRYPHLLRGGEHVSPVPKENTGDSLRLAQTVGAHVQPQFDGVGAAAWMPVSRVPFGAGRHGVFPHLLDRYKPGVIGVLQNGQRFTNESNSYHDVGAAMIEACAEQKETMMWLVCDHATIRKYGLGYAKPAPMPLGGLIRKGYLFKGRTLAELAQVTGMDGANLERTVQAYNLGAQHGRDEQFQRGSTAFNRYLGDSDHQPNPCVAPVGQGPYYAVKVFMGDLGTFDGLRTTVAGEVLREDGHVIEGLYAVGNDRHSIMGGNYPGAGITLGPAMTFGWMTGCHLAGVNALNSLAKH